MVGKRSGMNKGNVGFIPTPDGRQNKLQRLKARMRETHRLKNGNGEMDNVGPPRVVHAVQAGIEDFELKGVTATHVGISDVNGGIKMVPIALAKHLERLAGGLSIATLEDIHPQIEDGNINVKINAKGCK